MMGAYPPAWKDSFMRPAARRIAVALAAAGVLTLGGTAIAAAPAAAPAAAAHVPASLVGD